MKANAWLFAILMGIIVPWIAFRVTEELVLRETEPTQTEACETSEAAQETTSAGIRVLMDGQVQTMALQEYLTGVLMGEMPADFAPEALKAQAVVARTYTLKNQKHPQASVCTDSACCQAYCAPADYLAAGHSAEQADTLRQAVLDTDGQVLTYDGRLIDATYFSCSGGRTEEALAVWGTDVPYLQAVDSPGEEHATHYVDTVHFTAAEFTACLGAELDGSPATWIGEVTYTAGGGVQTMQIGGTSYSGVQLRQLLGLRSTAFQMTAVGDMITVTTKGFGHRVGMSQYGADAMAVAGSDYSEILSHYYPGTELRTIDKSGDF